MYNFHLKSFDENVLIIIFYYEYIMKIEMDLQDLH